MARTTITIDTPVYNKIKNMSRRQHTTVTKVISGLLTEALRRQAGNVETASFAWHKKKMEAKIDVGDKDELYRLMDSHR